MTEPAYQMGDVSALASPRFEMLSTHSPFRAIDNPAPKDSYSGKSQSVYKRSGLFKSLVGSKMTGKIFISYRRDDSSASAGRLYDRLAARFPKNQIFIDVDNLDPAVDFVEAIEQSVGVCDVLIAVIGRRWLSISVKS